MYVFHSHSAVLIQRPPPPHIVRVQICFTMVAATSFCSNYSRMHRQAIFSDPAVHGAAFGPLAAEHTTPSHAIVSDPTVHAAAFGPLAADALGGSDAESSDDAINDFLDTEMAKPKWKQQTRLCPRSCYCRLTALHIPARQPRLRPLLPANPGGRRLCKPDCVCRDFIRAQRARLLVRIDHIISNNQRTRRRRAAFLKQKTLCLANCLSCRSRVFFAGRTRRQQPNGAWVV